MNLSKYLFLPAEITTFERRYLSRLNKVALVFFWLHIPIFMAVAAAAGTDAILALILTSAVLIGPTVAYRWLENPRGVSLVYGVTAMLMGGLLVHFGQGSVQIEMHFYFFALLAMLCMFANPTVNLVAALAAAVHHLMVWWLMPASIFNYDAPWWVVGVHSAFVVLETVAACYISREFFDNVIGLEKIVEARTLTIEQNQRDMRLILDNVREGLVTIDLHGRMSGETSRTLVDWFGQPPMGSSLPEWLSGKDPSFAEWLALGLENVLEGMLPPAITLSQLPVLLKNGDHTYQIGYQLIEDTSAGQTAVAVLSKILVIVTDVTERLRGEAAEQHHAEMLQLFQHMMRDKSGFLEFLTEAEDLMRSITTGVYDDLDHFRRLVHTLKGNAGIFGMQRLSSTCHDLESVIEEKQALPTQEELIGLQSGWNAARASIEDMVGDRRSGVIEIDDYDYRAILKSVLQGADAAITSRMIESWRFESTSKRLARVEQQIRGLAERMGKDNVRVAVLSHDLRFDSDHFAPFWSAFIHVLRNTVDHGIEDPEMRALKGKPTESLITVSTCINGGDFVVAVEDDGPGINWEKLRARAGELGIKEFATGDPADLIFMDGISCKSAVSDVSGRGVGMAAVRESCHALGGRIEISSIPDRGTTIRFLFPKNKSVYEGHEAVARSSDLMAHSF